MLPKLSVGRIVTFIVMFAVTTAILKFAPIPENVKNFFRI